MMNFSKYLLRCLICLITVFFLSLILVLYGYIYVNKQLDNYIIFEFQNHNQKMDEISINYDPYHITESLQGYESITCVMLYKNEVVDVIIKSGTNTFEHSYYVSPGGFPNIHYISLEDELDYDIESPTLEEKYYLSKIKDTLIKKRKI